MTESLQRLLDASVLRHAELERALGDPALARDPQRLRTLSRDFARLAPVVERYRQWRRCEEELAEVAALRADAELRELADEDQARLEAERCALEQALLADLAPDDPQDACDVFLEIRAGTGGDEAALFAGDLYRMYERYAAQRGWTVESLTHHEGEHGGFRELVVQVRGADVYGRLRFESGTHRVQRIPKTESQGRIHTSAATVAVLAQSDDGDDDAELREDDLSVDTFRASGAGGQHVNKTDSAVRITHLPSGIVVECQDNRSQHRNRSQALTLLRARLTERARAQRRAEEAALRRSLVGSGDRSERIRTYNFPQGRVTDHRIDLTVHALPALLEGALDLLVEPLRAECQAQRLAAHDAA